MKVINTYLFANVIKGYGQCVENEIIKDMCESSCKSVGTHAESKSHYWIIYQTLCINCPDPLQLSPSNSTIEFKLLVWGCVGKCHMTTSVGGDEAGKKMLVIVIEDPELYCL